MHSHCHEDVIQFLIIFKRIFLVARYRALKIFSRECPSKCSLELEHAKTKTLTYHMQQIVHTTKNNTKSNNTLPPCNGRILHL